MLPTNLAYSARFCPLCSACIVLGRMPVGALCAFATRPITALSISVISTEALESALLTLEQITSPITLL